MNEPNHISENDALANPLLQSRVRDPLVGSMIGRRETTAPEESKASPFDHPNAQNQDGGLASTRQVQNIGAVTSSITDFTLRLNPSADHLVTQANEENRASTEMVAAGGGDR